MSTSRCNSLLIANRGEIARRIIRTCRRMGIRVVAVYSDVDGASLFVEEADEAIRIGPTPAADSYLNIPAILDAARRAAVDAVHPGYGFLAENADFARACATAGLTFIGPTAEAIAAMGDKRAARALAVQCGLPILPGYHGRDGGDTTLAREAARLGYPIMVKAANGGGGKGMRLVHEPAGLPDALAAARREAVAAFGSDDLLLERALIRPQHIEIQILGDRHGHIVHLGERDCSLQRRHQKVIEESPAPNLPPDLRAAMGAAAVTLAAAIGYTGAGTVEFLLDGDHFYFLEMNTRLQVEHPVTELVTGIDLVEWQVRVAEGEVLPWKQDEIHRKGHAIEARLYAEDPANHFLPSTGPVLLWRPPPAEGVRVDGSIRAGDEVTTHYDPMLAKIIARGDSRADAIRRLRRALERTTLLGLTTNLAYLIGVMADPAFLAGDVTTHFLDDHAPARPLGDEDLEMALIAAALARWRHDEAGGPGYWRNNPGDPAPLRFAAGGREFDVRLRPIPRRRGELAVDEFAVTVSANSTKARAVTLNRYAAPDLTLTIDDCRRRVAVAAGKDAYWVQTRSGVIRLEIRSPLSEPARPRHAIDSLRAPMPGTVLAVLVEVGQTVAAGQPLMKLEAMKMEHTIRAAAAGTVEAIYFTVGDQVATGEVLARLSGG